MSTGKVFCSELQKLIAPVVGASAHADENAVFPQLFPLRFFFYLFIGKNALLSKNGTAAENGRMRSYRMSGKDDCGIVVVVLPGFLLLAATGSVFSCSFLLLLSLLLLSDVLFFIAQREREIERKKISATNRMV